MADLHIDKERQKDDYSNYTNYYIKNTAMENHFQFINRTLNIFVCLDIAYF